MGDSLKAAHDALMEKRRGALESASIRPPGAGAPTLAGAFGVLGEAARAWEQEREKDPNGKDPHTPGAKLDAGKLDLTLPPPALVEAVARVMQHGVEKYARNGWREVPDAGRRYYAALKRHLHAFERGEDVDPDSGLHHLDHAATNIAFLLWFLQQGHEIGEWR